MPCPSCHLLRVRKHEQGELTIVDSFFVTSDYIYFLYATTIHFYFAFCDFIYFLFMYNVHVCP